MLSCDTMAVCAAWTNIGQNILAKNSDRPTAESQMLRFFPARENPKGALVHMTDLAIADVEKTYAVIGSQPYWIWGFEMGYNECGLMIGNEAEGSKCEPETETGILGMDLLRLGLERAATAREAIAVITSLLEQYGQNANASQLVDRRYENTYMLVDPKEAWVLETAGRQWVAKQVKDKLGISNAYTVGREYDLSSASLERISRENRWQAPDEPFDFALAYTKQSIRQTQAVPRMRRLNKLLQGKEKQDVADLKAILRDHFEGEINEPRFGASGGTFMSICMHMREWGESETVASLICHHDPILGPVARFLPAQPCQSLYVPVYFTGYIPKKLSTGDRMFSADSLWWKAKRLSLIASVDERFGASLTDAARCEEARIEAMAVENEEEAKALVAKGRREEAYALLNETMDRAVAMAEAWIDTEYARISAKISARGGLYGPNAEKIARYCEYAAVPLL